MSGRLRAVYLADTMADLRNIEGLTDAFDVTFLAPQFMGERATNYWPPVAPVNRVWLGGGRVGFMLRAAAWLRAHRAEIDIVYVLDETTAALAAVCARRLGGPPVILQVARPTVEYVRCKAGHEPRWRNKGRELLATALVAVNETLADGIGAVSEYCAAQSRRHNREVRFIPFYGVDTEVFSPRWSKTEARAMLDLPAAGPIVMLRSRIAPEKDPETFVRAIALLRTEGRTICATYMGGELAEFAEVTDRLGVEVIARKPADFEEIPVWYVAADVDVQTSRAEGLGISPLEALACLTPVVVTDVGGLREVVDGGRVGELVPLGDPVALAGAIAMLLDDPDRAAAQAAQGRRWVQERFGRQPTFTAWTAFGTDLARRQKASRRRPQGSSRRRILFVDHETRLSGGQRDLVDLLGALAEHGSPVEAHVVLPGEGPLADALRAAGATVHFAAMDHELLATSRWELARSPAASIRRGAGLVRAAHAIRAVARQVRPDLIHSNSMKAHVLAIPAARTVRAPLVWHVRDVLEAGWLKRGFVSAGRIGADRVICISHAAAESFTDTPLASRLRVVPNGIAPRPFDAEAQAAARAALAQGDGPGVGIVGQLAWWKGQDVFVEAAALISAQRPGTCFAIVGDCLFPQNEGEFVESTRRRAEVLGLTNLRWTGPMEPIEPVMAALDVCVHASRLPEPFGRVIVEAMAQGTPVVTTTAGAGAELVPPEAGAVVEAGDPSRLAAAVLGLLDDNDPARAPAARRAAARYGLDATAAGVRAVWDDLLGEAGTPA